MSTSDEDKVTSPEEEMGNEEKSAEMNDTKDFEKKRQIQQQTTQNLFDDIIYDYKDIRRHTTFIENINETISTSLIKTRLSVCEKLLSRIEDRSRQLRKRPLSAGDRTKLFERLDTNQEAAWETIALFNDAISSRKSSSSTSSAVPQEQTAVASTSATQSPKVKFPVITLPEFHGNLDDWMEFRDRFDSLVNKNKQLSKVDKFNYLLAAVKLPAGHTSVLKNFTLSEDSYDLAWKAFCERYDDKPKLKSQQFDKMMTVKRMGLESATELRRIIDEFAACFSTLDLLDASYEDLRVHVVLFRLEPQTRKDWQKFIGEDDPSWEKLKEFLTKQWKTLLTVAEPVKKPPAKSSEMKTSIVTPKSFTTTSAAQAQSCPVCGEAHPVYKCTKFRNSSTSEKMNTVQTMKLCRNCLMPGHIQRNCLSTSRCRVCNGPHHTLLHFEKKQQSIQSGLGSAASTSSPPGNQSLSANAPPFSQVSQPNVNYLSPPASTNLHATTMSFPATVDALLSTVRLLVLDVRGNWHRIRALLDSGSQSNYVTSEIASLLGIELKTVNMPVVGVNGQSSVIRSSTAVIYSSMYKEFFGTALCLVSEDITGYLPQRPVNVSNFNFPEGIFLADPTFHVPGKIDMLLGTGIFHKSLLNNSIQYVNMPKLVETYFGWTLGGEFPRSLRQSSLISCFTQLPNSGYEELDQKLEKFMELENFESQSKLLTHDEAFCEKLFQETTYRDKDGRIHVELPFNDSINNLGNNLSNSLRQFYYQEGVRMKDSQLHGLYRAYINEMIEAKHLTEVSGSGKIQGHFLPHHGVKRMTSTTTKVRPVCNGSSKSETGKSLNDCLRRGPTVQPEMFDILIRFRERKIVVKCDLEKMFRQIFVVPEQRKYQKILWRDSPDEPLRHYELNTVVFGLTPSPFLATRSLNFIADENEMKFPEACKVIKTSFYVDDLLFSCDSIEEALKLRDQLRYLLSSSHFPARKWLSNDPKVLENLPKLHVETVENDSSTIKALGVVWNPTVDEITFEVKLPEKLPKTKAEVLSEIASIHDPLGLAGPVVLSAKLFMKPLRLLKWTDNIPDNIMQAWHEFRQKLLQLNNVKVQRHAVICKTVSNQIHGFSDAAEPAFGAAIYLRSSDSFGNVQVTLLCSKSRVSPPKQKSIPRLELCAATLLSKLVTRILKILTVEVDNVFLWTDSMIVLWWISAVAARLSVFVGNRIAVIQELTEKFTWHHVPGTLNPSDDVSRGLLAEDLFDRSQWWNGPEFLSSPEAEWPKSILTLKENHPDVERELRKTLLATKTSNLLTFIESRFSSVEKIKKSFVYIRRMTAKESIGKTGPISLQELELAEESIIKVLQNSMFPEEIRFFEKLRDDPETKTKFPQKSPLLSLMPFMDNRGVIRVGGRLQACQNISAAQKHPPILPRCNFVKLLVRKMHNLFLHPGQNAMLANVRQHYWPLDVRSVIRKVQHECIVCFRARPKFVEQLMSSLPEARVKMSPPFLSTAVDYAGAFTIRTSLTKKSSTTKAYVAMFKCMCTGAIHLEAVTSLSTPSFIATFDRFISRRGLSAKIFSDNGTQFVGTDNEFHRILAEIEPQIATHLCERGIQWKFTTPLAPHAGGIYESGVKSMKHHLVRECADRSFDFEQFSTLLCKIEAVLNSRPLTPMTDDPRDLDVLTPAHFLVGRPLISKPERNFLPVNTGRLDKFNQIQQLQQKLWSRWYMEYLHNLQTRPIHFRQRNEFHLGDLVLIKDQNLPTLKWLRGRIIRLIPDKVGTVRNVVLKTSTGEKTRDVRYICFLPLEPSEASSRPECVS